MLPLESRHWPVIAPPGGRVFIGSGAACPHGLMASMLKARQSLKDIELVQIMTLGPTPWIEPEYRETFQVNAFFLNSDLRGPVNDGEADYTPCFLSELPSLFRHGVLPLSTALIMVSPPDKAGMCSLGVSVDVVMAAIKSAKTVVAQINPRMPRTHGNTEVHCDQIDYFIEEEVALPESGTHGHTEEAGKIAEYVAQLVEDGSTLQVGIGNIPDQICKGLKGHRHLGLHTEFFSDGVRELMELGVIDNSRKPIHTGQSVASFCIGSQALYDFVDNNYQLSFQPTDYTNHIPVITQHPGMVSINSAVEVDITGQAAADTIAGKFYSGIGGLIDFTRGAAMSERGLPILALPSTANGGEVSRIVPYLSHGAGVVCSRADVHFVVTEYGIATLRGRSIRERVLELIQVAHPKFREDLLRHAREHKWIAEYERLVPRPASDIGSVDSEKIILHGKSYLLRPLQPSDERRLQEFFYSHTEETIHKRYGYHLSTMTKSRAHELTGVNQERDLALGVFEVRGPVQRLHAIGRYFLDEDEKSAECAFVVREQKRRHGMGKLLFERMCEVAKRRKLDSLWAIVATDNLPMLNLFKSYGCRLSRNTEDAKTLKVQLLF